MSPKKTILRALHASYRDNPAEPYRRPADIPGFRDRPDLFQRATNELLKTRLIEGRKDTEGHMTVALNQHRLEEVARSLRPAWAHPAVWAALILGTALGAGLMM